MASNHEPVKYGRKRKRTDLSIEKKLEVLEKLEQGISAQRIADEYNVGRRTIYNIKSRKQSIHAAYQSSHTSSSRKRLSRKATHCERGKACEDVTADRNGSLVDVVPKKKAKSKDTGAAADETGKSSNSGLSHSEERTGESLNPVDIEAVELLLAIQSSPAVPGDAPDNQSMVTSPIPGCSKDSTPYSQLPGDNGITQQRSPLTEQIGSSDLPTTIPNSPYNSEPSQICHYCSLKNKNNRATKYCKECKLNICPEHLQPHENLFGDHHHLSEAVQSEVLVRAGDETCRRHPQSTYITGCENCLEIFCVECMCLITTAEEKKECLYPCTDGKRHCFYSLSQLHRKLKNKLKTQLDAAEKQQKDADNVRKRILTELHEMRDRRLKSIADGYMRIEKDVIRELDKDLQPQDIQSVIKDLHLAIRELNTQGPDMNENLVDVINRHKQFKDDKTLCCVPSKPHRQHIFKNIGDSSDVSIRLDWIIDPLTPPASSSLLRATPLKDIINNHFSDEVIICHHKQTTYLGLTRSLTRNIYAFDKDGCSSVFASLSDDKKLYSMTILKGKLYVLTADGCVYVYSLSGEVMTSWKMNSSSYSIAAVGDELIAVCAPHLIVFDEEGNEVRRLSDVISGRLICSVDCKSVVVCNYEFWDVRRVDIRTGDILWSNTDIDAPCAAYDGHGNLFVMDFHDVIQVLDISTGKIVKRMMLPSFRSHEDFPKLILTSEGELITVGYCKPKGRHQSIGRNLRCERSSPGISINIGITDNTDIITVTGNSDGETGAPSIDYTDNDDDGSDDDSSDDDSSDDEEEPCLCFYKLNY